MNKPYDYETEGEQAPYPLPADFQMDLCGDSVLTEQDRIELYEDLQNIVNLRHAAEHAAQFIILD